MSLKPNAVIFNNGTARHFLDEVFSAGRLERIASLTKLYDSLVGIENFEEHVGNLSEVEVAFSTWGIPPLTEEQLEQLPKLRAVFYAAGSVKNWAGPFWKRDILIVSGQEANSRSVAEFCLAQTLLACRGYFRNIRDCQNPKTAPQNIAFTGRGAYGESVALIGLGCIAQHFARLLQDYDLRVLAVDPYVSATQAEKLGVKLVDLKTAFHEAYVVSNHLPDLPELVKILNAPLFQSMRQDATFINTGRGAQVDEEALVATLQARPDLTALLDVTHPEPSPTGHPFYTMPNVIISSHIAGAVRDERLRMTDWIIEDFKRWTRGEALRYNISPEGAAISA